jgi:manganese transport protein
MILLAAATFFHSQIPVSELQQAENLLMPLLGKGASLVFAIALLFAGIASSITSGMAGGSIFAGFFTEPYDIKDNHSKLGVAVSLVSALLLIFFITDPFKGLIYSQMFLSIQLPITIFLQIHLTSSNRVMGKYTNKPFTKFTLIVIGIIVAGFNILLLLSLFFPIGIN